MSIMDFNKHKKEVWDAPKLHYHFACNPSKPVRLVLVQKFKDGSVNYIHLDAEQKDIENMGYEYYTVRIMDLATYVYIHIPTLVGVIPQEYRGLV